MATPYRKQNIANAIRESSRLVPIHGTPYKIAVPHNISEYGSNNKFTLGHILCWIDKGAVKTNQPLPASWFISIN